MGARNIIERMGQIPSDQRLKLVKTLPQTAFDRGLWQEQNQTKSSVPFMIQPLLIDLRSQGYVHHVAWQIRLALRRLSRLVEDLPEVAELLPLEDHEREWFQRHKLPGGRIGNPKGERVFCRLDGIAPFQKTNWRKHLKFVETNAVGVGGLTYTPALEETVLNQLWPMLQERDEEFTLQTNFDPRILLLDDLLDHARALYGDEKPTIALVEDRTLYTLGGEMGRLCPFYRSLGVNCLVVDPRELEVNDKKEVMARGQRIHVIYRFLELRELGDMEIQSGKPLVGMHQAFENRMVVPSIGGDLEHKSAFEILTNPDFASAFTGKQRKVIERHVLWTRLLFDRRTTDKKGNDIDLLNFVRVHRDELVIKPNRSYGGVGVTIGQFTSQSDWEKLINQSSQETREWVVQEACALTQEECVVLKEDGALEHGKYYLSAGFYPGRRGLGIFGRYCKSSVVNINRGGGMIPVLVNVT